MFSRPKRKRRAQRTSSLSYASQSGAQCCEGTERAFMERRGLPIIDSTSVSVQIVRES